MLIDSAMRLAIRTAVRGIKAGQSPFGAVILDASAEPLAAEHNCVHELCDPSAHAEVMAIRSACKRLGQRDLSDCQIISTCEPCPMCAAAIVFSGIRTVIFGASVGDAKQAGYQLLQIPCEDVFNLGNVSVRLQKGILADECVTGLFKNRP